MARRGELQPVQIDRFSTLAPQATSSIGVTANFSNIQDNAKAGEEESPYFFAAESFMTPAIPGYCPTIHTPKSMQITAYDAGRQPQAAYRLL